MMLHPSERWFRVLGGGYGVRLWMPTPEFWRFLFDEFAVLLFLLLPVEMMKRNDAR